MLTIEASVVGKDAQHIVVATCLENDPVEKKNEGKERRLEYRETSKPVKLWQSSRVLC